MSTVEDTGGVQRAGYIALAGRPSVGKSTLLNRLIGEKISIVSPRPQTTRHRIHGILTTPSAQFVFVDMPGLQIRHGGRLNQALNRAAEEALESVDVVVLIIEAMRFGSADRAVIARLPRNVPVLLAVNKVDLVSDKRALLPFIDEVSKTFAFEAIVPISGRTGRQLEDLLATLEPLLPAGNPIYGADELTDRSERFLAAEFVREQLFRSLGEELPYAAAVEIEQFETTGNLRRIHAAIVVDRPGQKAIVIGQGGAQLKVIATAARKEMERLFGGKVYLEVWVRVRRGWADDPNSLRRLGYE